MQELLRYLSFKPKRVSAEEWHAWRRNKITRELFHDIVEAVIDRMTESPPLSADQSVPFVHQREGYNQLVESITKWEPSTIANPTKEIDESDD